MKRLTSLLFAIVATTTMASASDFNEGGMYFTITSSTDKTVEIACKSAYEYSNGYEGTVEIPTTVVHDGVTYTVTGIGKQCFSTCANLRAVIIPEGIKYIGIDAFRGDYNMGSITLPNSLERIDNMAFQGSGIGSIVIPDKVQVVGNMTFAKCWGLSSVVIGKGVHTIEQNAFYDSTGIQEVTVYNPEPPHLHEKAFSNWNATLYVPAASLEKYRVADQWNRFGNLKAIDEGPEGPQIVFHLSKSYVTVGETVTVTLKTPEGSLWGINWELPEGVTLVEGSTSSDEITLRADTEGQKAFTVTVVDDDGNTNVVTRRLFDVLTNDEISAISNVALEKVIHSFSGSQANGTKETPDFLLDGLTAPTDLGLKWCNDASNHWAIIDLQGLYDIYNFKVYDCKAGRENYENFSNYRIQVSTDAETWDMVVDETGREADNIKTDYIAPTKARYIRFNPYSKASFTIRIWEFEAYGVEVSNNMTVSGPATAVVKGGETATVAFDYDLHGDQRAADFSATATTDNEHITVSGITDDVANSRFIVSVTADKVFGYGTLQITANNGGARRSASTTLTIDSDAPDVAAAVVPETFKKDGQLWTIVSAPAVWNVSKIEASTKQAAAFSSFSFMLSNDKQSWSEVYTTNDITASDPVSYILPQYREARHVAVVGTYSGTVADDAVSVSVYEQLPDGIKEQEPVTIASGWNADVIAETLPAASHTNAVLDDQGWVLYTENVFSEGGLPIDGFITAASGDVFQLGNVADNNAACLKVANETVTLNFDTPQQASQLQLLSISANGESNLRVKVNYDDGTSKEETFSIADWYSGTKGQGEALYGLSRVITRKEADWVADNKDYRNQFRLFEQTLDTDIAKVITSVSLTSTKSGSYPTVIALSRTGHSVPTGISKPEYQRTGSQAAYNLQGQRVNAENYKGIVIVDGKKMLKK